MKSKQKGWGIVCPGLSLYLYIFLNNALPFYHNYIVKINTLQAVFRDDISTFTLENVENIQYNGSNGKWSIMFDDYEVQEVDGQLLEIQS